MPRPEARLHNSLSDNDTVARWLSLLLWGSFAFTYYRGTVAAGAETLLSYAIVLKLGGGLYLLTWPFLWPW